MISHAGTQTAVDIPEPGRLVDAHTTPQSTVGMYVLVYIQLPARILSVKPSPHFCPEMFQLLTHMHSMGTLSGYP